MTRERLVRMLWGDQPDERARHNLRQTLSTYWAEARSPIGCTVCEAPRCALEVLVE